ncbi:MAG: hypothetical protein GX345_05510 [Clostridiales bacterium]|nr:hypothetical protein [Clostridiales bacterium]
MKKTANRALIFALVLLFLLVFSACKPRDASDPESSQAPDGMTLVRKDEDGLVEIQIKNGAATISFDYDRWDELHRVFEDEDGPAIKATLPQGPMKINGLEGNVQDACIGKVEALDWTLGNDFVTPSVFLLMEDGSVGHFLAVFPYPEIRDLDQPFDEDFWEADRLPFLEGIESLTYESSKEGQGEMTVLAQDDRGLSYDLRLPVSIVDIFEGTWIGNIRLTEDEEGHPTVSHLTFLEDGTLYYDVGIGRGPSISEFEMWEGTYNIVLAEGQAYPPGTISLELNREWQITRDQENQAYISQNSQIKGSYRFASPDRGILDFYPNTGDLLYPYEEDFEYSFWLYYRADQDIGLDNMSDSDLSELLVSQVGGVYDMVQAGMSTLVTGEISEVPYGGFCKDIWLGTNHEGKFTKEILYSIGQSGAIYEYDAVEDFWAMVSGEADAQVTTSMAYVKFFKTHYSGHTDFYVDTVLWIDDDHAPNGYRIENPNEEWLPYLVNRRTQFYFLNYDNPDFEKMESVEMNMDQALAEAQKYFRDEEGFLAKVTAEGSKILSIKEIYVP